MKCLLRTVTVLLAVACILPFQSPAAAMEAEDAPTSVTIDYLEDLYQAVEFDHQLHTDMYQCNACHHHTTGELPTQESCCSCHTTSKILADLSRSGCHTVRRMVHQAARTVTHSPRQDENGSPCGYRPGIDRRSPYQDISHPGKERQRRMR